MVLRFVLWWILAYLFWKFLRSLFNPLAPKPRKPKDNGRPAGPRRHAPDFSDVPDAEFEDITPPKPTDAPQE